MVELRLSFWALSCQSKAITLLGPAHSNLVLPHPALPTLPTPFLSSSGMFLTAPALSLIFCGPPSSVAAPWPLKSEPWPHTISTALMPSSSEQACCYCREQASPVTAIIRSSDTFFHS